MDLLQQIAGFSDYAMVNRLSAGQIALYFALLDIMLRSDCQEWFPVCNTTLQLKSGLSLQGVIKAKNSLKQRNLIDFENGKSRKSPIYKLTEFSANSVSNSVSIGVSNSVTNGVNNGEKAKDSIFNINNKYINNFTTTTQDRLDGSSNIKCISHYEQNIGVITPKAAEMLTDYLNSGIEDEMLCLCIDEAVRANARNLNYIDKIILNCQNQGIVTANAFLSRTKSKRKAGAEQGSDSASGSGSGWGNIKML